MKLRLEEVMAKRNVSQSQVADALGLTRATVSSWLVGKVRRAGERATVYPDLDSLDRLCRFLEVTPNDLLELDSPLPSHTWRDVGAPRRGRPPKHEAAVETYTVFSLDLGLENHDQAIEFGRQYAQELQKAFSEVGLRIRVLLDEQSSDAEEFTSPDRTVEECANAIAGELWERMFEQIA